MPKMLKAEESHSPMLPILAGDVPVLAAGSAIAPAFPAVIPAHRAVVYRAFHLNATNKLNGQSQQPTT
jgi:hypothetical protein